MLLLKKGSIRRKGKDALRGNIVASKTIAEIVKSTLGPRGMDKMLLARYDRLIVTNDGATILDEMDVKHPAAKMMAELAKTQHQEVGDGTTTAVVTAAELLKKAEVLLDQNIHPTVIVHGFKMAVEQATKMLDELSVKVNLEDREVLKKIAITSMCGKGIEAAKDHFAEISIRAVKQAAEKRGDGYFVDIDDIQLVKRVGKSLNDTELIQGVIVNDRGVVNPEMPKYVRNAKVALIKFPLERALARQRPGYGGEITIRDPYQMKAFVGAESEIIQKIVDKIKKAGANVLMCGSRIDEKAQHILENLGIMAVQQVKDSTMEKLSRATRGKIVKDPMDITDKDLGSCGVVEERKFGNDKMVFVQECEEPKSVSIFIRAGLERLADEIERVLRDSISVIANVYMKDKIVAGGGAIEAELAKRVRKYARKVVGREQLAVEAFADALEAIPRTLCENAGLDPIDILVDLRASHEDKNGVWQGVDVFNGGIVDMMKKGVIEPLRVKELAIKSAVEAASVILRVDDVILAPESKPSKGTSHRAPG